MSLILYLLVFLNGCVTSTSVESNEPVVSSQTSDITEHSGESQGGDQSLSLDSEAESENVEAPEHDQQEAEDGQKAPQIILGRSFIRTDTDGTEYPPAPVIPEGYQKVQPLDPPPRLKGSVWLRRWNAKQKSLECQQWQFRSVKGPKNLVIERRYSEQWGKGRSVMREFIPLIGGPVEFEMYCTGYQRRWIRRPDPTRGMPGLKGACSAVWRILIVSADPEKIAYIETDWVRPVIAYHPEALNFWFLTEEACESQ